MCQPEGSDRRSPREVRSLAEEESVAVPAGKPRSAAPAETPGEPEETPGESAETPGEPGRLGEPAETSEQNK